MGYDLLKTKKYNKVKDAQKIIDEQLTEYKINTTLCELKKIISLRLTAGGKHFESQETEDRFFDRLKFFFKLIKVQIKSQNIADTNTNIIVFTKAWITTTTYFAKNDKLLWENTIQQIQTLHEMELKKNEVVNDAVDDSNTAGNSTMRDNIDQVTRESNAVTNNEGGRDNGSSEPGESDVNKIASKQQHINDIDSSHCAAKGNNSKSNRMTADDVPVDGKVTEDTTIVNQKQGEGTEASSSGHNNGKSGNGNTKCSDATRKRLELPLQSKKKKKKKSQTFNVPTLAPYIDDNNEINSPHVQWKLDSRWTWFYVHIILSFLYSLGIQPDLTIDCNDPAQKNLLLEGMVLLDLYKPETMGKEISLDESTDTWVLDPGERENLYTEVLLFINIIRSDYFVISEVKVTYFKDYYNNNFKKPIKLIDGKIDQDMLRLLLEDFCKKKLGGTISNKIWPLITNMIYDVVRKNL